MMYECPTTQPMSEVVNIVSPFEPSDRHLRVHVLGAQLRVVEVAPGDGLHRFVEAAPVDEDLLRRAPGEPDRFVDERFVKNDLPHAAAAVGGDHELRPRVVDPRGEARRRESAEHHRMDRADPRAREDNERRLGDHGHVDDDAVALAHSERSHHRRRALHLDVKLAVAEAPLLARLRGEIDERFLVPARREVPVDRVVAEVGLAADEPSGERRPAVVEHSGVRPLPVHELRLLAPEAFAVRDRAAMEFAVGGHEPLL